MLKLDDENYFCFPKFKIIFLEKNITRDSYFPGVLGIKVKIMLPWDPQGKMGPKRPLPDSVNILEPKEEPLPTQAYSEHKGTPMMDVGAPPMGVQ